jgi:chaperonin cofactor prefoldin
MSDLQNKLDKVISDIEKRLTNKEDFEYVKTQIYNIYTIFLDEFDKLEAKCNEKMEDIAVRCKVLDDRMSEIEESIQKIESDIYIKENEEFDFDVICPYCDAEFSVDFSEGPKDSIVCPECENTIELDWNDEHDHEGCSGHCHDCGDDCCGHDHDEEDEDDDM